MSTWSVTLIVKKNNKMYWKNNILLYYCVWFMTKNK